MFWFDSNLRRIRFIELSSELEAPILDRFQIFFWFCVFSIRSFKFWLRHMVSFRWRTVNYIRCLKHRKYDIVLLIWSCNHLNVLMWFILLGNVSFTSILFKMLWNMGSWMTSFIFQSIQYQDLKLTEKFFMHFDSNSGYWFLLQVSQSSLRLGSSSFQLRQALWSI